MPSISITARMASRYVFASLAIGLTTALLYLWRSSLGTPLMALLYLLPVGLSTAFWGLGPGVLTAVWAFLAFNYFFIEPNFTLVVHRTEDTLVLLVFLVVAVVISQLVGRAQAGLAAARARELEATRLYELSTALAGLLDVQAIGRTLCEQVRSTFQADRVELARTGNGPFPAPEVSLPPETMPEPRAATLIAVLQTARGQLGEIRLWRDSAPISNSEDRLLRTFASQGALALERAWLAEAEQRAHVLEESDRLKSAILSSVSHELRTPLATIKAAATSLRSGEVAWESAARAVLLGAIDDESDHLNRLVGNLLDMSRIEAGALRPSRQWNLLREIVGGVVERMRPLTGHHQLELDMPEDLPLVPVDYVQIEQVFTNLISNCLKYAPPHTQIRVSARPTGDGSLQVQVSNQGPPVPEQDLARIFDKFYRITAADRVTGTGLGLSICKGIVEAHGGRIWAENLPVGFAFNFTLPTTWDGNPPPNLPPETE
jgi:two-component system sensor histidine kinase KdpD